MKFKLKVDEREYILTFTPAAISLFMRLMTAKTIPNGEAEKRLWEEELNRGWKVLIGMVCDPKPKEDDELLIMLALIQIGGDLINRISTVRLEEVQNS